MFEDAKLNVPYCHPGFARGPEMTDLAVPLIACAAVIASIVFFAFNVQAGPRVQRFVGCLMLAGSCGAAYLGWHDYRWNREVFQRSFGDSDERFESIEGFVSKLKLEEGQAFTFNVGKDGQVRPAGVWRVGGNDLVAAFVLFPWGLWLLFRRGERMPKVEQVFSP